MKKSKFIFAIALALMICLLIVPSAFADGDDPPGEGGEQTVADLSQTQNSGSADTPTPTETPGTNPETKDGGADEKSADVESADVENAGVKKAVANSLEGAPNALSEEGTDSDQGTLQEITDIANVDGDTITVENAELNWYPADSTIGRYQEGWWVGVNIVAPDSVTDANVDKVKYANNAKDPMEKSFDANNDGKTDDGNYYMGCWLPVKQEYLDGALKNESNLTWTYRFDWDGDTFEDQTFQMVVNPNNITLNKDNQVYCQTVDGEFTYRDGKNVVGTIEEITSTGTVNGSTITVDGADLAWYPADNTIGRYDDGWWVGVKIVAPEYVDSTNVTSVMYSNDGSDTLNKSFDTNRDGDYWMNCWLPVMPEYLEAFLNAGQNLTWAYKFDWTGDKAADQTFRIVVNPNNVTLNKDGAIECQTVNGKFTYRDGVEVKSDESIVAPDPRESYYVVLEGADAVWTKGSAEGLEFRLNSVNPLVKVLIDGEEVTFEQGEDGLVTVAADVLESLEAGVHTITFVYSDGGISVNLVIEA